MPRRRTHCCHGQRWWQRAACLLRRLRPWLFSRARPSSDAPAMVPSAVAIERRRATAAAWARRPSRPLQRRPLQRQYGGPGRRAGRLERGRQAAAFGHRGDLQHAAGEEDRQKRNAAIPRQRPAAAQRGRTVQRCVGSKQNGTYPSPSQVSVRERPEETTFAYPPVTMVAFPILWPAESTVPQPMVGVGTTPPPMRRCYRTLLLFQQVTTFISETNSRIVRESRTPPTRRPTHPAAAAPLLSRELVAGPPHTGPSPS